ncbi:MAG: radical SAM protein [Candidatus Omnitrophota bacterium]
MFELTYRCNFRCPHCYVEGSKKRGKELTTRQVFTILDQMREMGVWSVGFTGGEALLRKDIFDILGYAKRGGFQTALLSNGYLIDKKTADKLARANVNNVDITFNSLKPDIFEKLTGVKNSLKKAKAAIGLLIKRGVRVEIKSIAMTINRDELVNISRFARSLNIIHDLDTEILPCRNGYTASVDSYSLNSDEVEATHRTVYPEMFHLVGRKISCLMRKRDRMFNCGVGRSLFSITPYGKMNFCIEINYPECSLLKYGVSRCWEKIKEEVDRLNKTPDFVCESCDLVKYCGWCAGRSYMETGIFNKCSEYFKKRAIETKERRMPEWTEKR